MVDDNFVFSLKNKLKKIKEKKKKIFICGNGGSACNAIHFAEDLMSLGFRAMHLCDIGFLTATANDYGYEYVFSRPLKLWSDPGDLLITLSCSGTSENIWRVQKTAKDMNIDFIALPTNKETNLSTPQTENIHLEIIHKVYEYFKYISVLSK